MKTRQTLARITLALATVMFPFLHAHSWDWEWTDTWNEAVATCGECGEEYTFYAESSSEAEEIAAEFFCECGSCLADVNEECYQEHHCEFCDNCIEEGEYHLLMAFTRKAGGKKYIADLGCTVVWKDGGISLRREE